MKCVWCEKGIKPGVCVAQLGGNVMHTACHAEYCQEMYADQIPACVECSHELEHVNADCPNCL